MKSKVKIFVKANFAFDLSLKFQCNVIIQMWIEIDQN